ncbi:MAG: redoxin family protein [Planctomycetes bacterium]|nr:redoxin family protein [Planctomycetota bacterium]
MIAALFLALCNGDGLPIGASVGRVPFTDTRWLARELSDLGPHAATVVVFTSIDCPIAARVLPRVAELERKLRPRGVQFLALDVGPDDDLVEAAARALDQGCEFPLGRDFDGAATRALGATRTPECLVLDAHGTLAYRGRFDAAQRYSGNVPGEVRADLAEALEDVLAERAVRVPQTPLEGCLITPPVEIARADPAHTPTWVAQIAPLVARHCAACHVEGGMAPFALGTRAQLAAKAAMIEEVVLQRRMPPWFAARTQHFENELGLSREERVELVQWLRAGAPPGENGESVRAEPEHPPQEGWRIGKPDLVLSVLGSTKVPATGYVPYAYQVIPHLFLSDTWVEALEIRPSNPRVVHHANLGWYKLGDRVTAQNFLTGQVPGGDAMQLPEGVACCIPAGSLLGLQVHYVTSGRAEEDQISVGLRFPRGKVEQRLRHFELADFRFEIPPGAPAWPVRAQRTFAEDAIGVGLFVHMHLRGRDMRIVEQDPAGARADLLCVPNYSFDWQLPYVWRFGEKRFAKGTRLEALAHFDNSGFNPFNPDPAKAVRFGQETYDEMMYGFVFYVDAHEQLELEVEPATGQSVTR